MRRHWGKIICILIFSPLLALLGACLLNWDVRFGNTITKFRHNYPLPATQSQFFGVVKWSHPIVGDYKRAWINLKWANVSVVMMTHQKWEQPDE